MEIIKQNQQRINTDITYQKSISLLQQNYISTRKYAKKNTSKALAGNLSWNQNNFFRQHKSSLHVRLIGKRI